MPSFFSRLKGKDGPSKVKQGAQQSTQNDLPAKPRWEDAWMRTSVDPEEVQELLRGCTLELKSRALDTPFLLLPFRPTSDPSAARSFVRNFFDRGLKGEMLAQELRLTEPMVLCSVVKWCWSRLPGGVVGWEVYELFKVGESDSNMARDSFATFIPLSVESDARSKIIFDFFDLLSAIAAHAKTNGLGGRKLSRLAGWWGFGHHDGGKGFEGGYKGWVAAADAASHLFFAYLRSLTPSSVKGLNGISTLPMSLQKLVQETEYPPERPSLLQSRTMKVVMIVDAVSPTPFSLLRRANHFQYRDDDRALQAFSEYEDPVKALTDECRRVLKSISSANQSQVSTSKESTGLTDASWSRFEDIGFSGAFEEEDDDDESNFAKKRPQQGLRTKPQTKTINGGRPQTPSWADFLSSGFVDEAANGPAALLLPPDKVLPPLDIRGKSSQSHRPRLEQNSLEPGELASITRFDLDDSFWWVWISSLAGEETGERKAAFGRCALIETVIRGGRWLVMEEMVKGAAPAPEEGAYIAEKKSFWGRSKKNKGGVTRRKSTGKQPLESTTSLRPGLNSTQSMGASKTSIGPDQHARIQAAAIQLQQRQRQEESIQATARRGRNDTDGYSTKTSSVFTLQPVIMNEASPAMQWANKYDKDAIRDAYLADNATGRGLGEATMQTNGNAKSQDTLRPAYQPRENSRERDLPALPSPGPTQSRTPPPAPMPPTPGFDADEENHRHLSEKAAEVSLPGDAHPSDRSAAPSRLEAPSPEPRASVDQSGLSPESRAKHNKLKKKDQSAPPSSGGFRKMFGRNKSSKSAAQGPPQVINNGNGLQPGGASLGRRFSGFRRNKSPMASPSSESPSLTKQMTRQSMTQSISQSISNNNRNSEDSHQRRTPIASPAKPYDRSYDPSIQDDLSRVDTHDADEANQAFSSFDQGPLEDVPAFVPEDSPRQSPRRSLEEDEAVPPPISRVKSNGEEPTASPAQDRWAQIRKNAAERAAHRQSEEQSRGTGWSGKTDGDDAETSGEETIESRVARIKARVAELTGNMETGGDSPVSSTRPPRRPIN
ncbi:related to morphogenesis-related protein MSB1 [Rhynchosporium agropyri]|uniref:Related to morphogenesis-related protein MSB1 n=1 Tax=Rhynchosporium agropyri TaxID=914238 RepID=A0A1E1KLF0_9HELO|nr:related to morphogenesis-related protein MSB1 [Rhynchosporium agropyri]